MYKKKPATTEKKKNVCECPICIYVNADSRYEKENRGKWFVLS